MRTRSKRWCFTLNNFTDDEELEVRSLASQDSIQYLIYGQEVGANGTPHLQGYLETTTKKSLSSMKKLIGSRFHLEAAKGTAAQNKEYCTKEGGTIFEEGSPMSQGKRSDLDVIKKEIDEGASYRNIADNHFGKWVIYRRSFQEYMTLKITPRSWKTKVIVYWGKTGTGKTRKCHELADGAWTPGDFIWFDGYNGHESVIIDDYRGEYPLPMLLKLLDRYPMQVPIKGGFVTWAPKTVYITSNVEPKDWYCLVDERSHAAFMRRLDEINEVQEPLFSDIE